MAQVLAANLAAGALAGSIGPTATTINLEAGQGALFPSPSAGQYFVATLRLADESNPLNEIIHCTAVVGDTLTVVRAQEGTTGLSWAAGDGLLNEFTKGTFEILIQEQDLQDQDTNYAVDAGSANAYLANFVPAITTYVSGSPLRIKIANTNTAGACTLDAGAGAVAIKTGAGNNVQIGEIVGGSICVFLYVGGVFQLQSAPSGAAVVNVRTIRYTATATYTPPAGLIRADVTCYGPGGGGGAIISTGGAAGGGGGGAVARKILTKADIGASQAMTIPAGGAGGTAGGNGAAGAGNTSFGTLVVAGPGAGGIGNSGVTPIGGLGGVGGTPSAGDFLHYGYPGGGGFGANHDSGIGGQGGGPGGGRATFYSENGLAGSGVTGGGGSGGADNTNAGKTGGAGAPGSIEIVEYYGG